VAEGRRTTRTRGVAAAVRRRQNERGPRVAVQDAAGHPRVVAPSAPGYDDLLAIAERMIAEVEPRRPRRGRAGGGSRSG
jgi:hypothetical protein